MKSGAVALPTNVLRFQTKLSHLTDGLIGKSTNYFKTMTFWTSLVEGVWIKTK